MRLSFNEDGHTDDDWLCLTAAGVDPASTQPREHPVSCSICGTGTWHLAARCDRHYLAPLVARLAAAGAR